MSFDDRAPLPGSPQPYFLRRGEGEAAMVFDGLFTVLLSGDETGGQFGLFVAEAPAGDRIPTHAHADTHEVFYVVEGLVRVYVQDRDGIKTTRMLEPGDFGYVPAGLAHAYRVDEPSRLIGVTTGGFERFFATLGTDVRDGSEPFRPSPENFAAAAAAYRTEFLPDFDWPDD